jgi:hypothetical protein
MFDAPSKKTIKSAKVTKDSIGDHKKLEICYLSEKEIEEREAKKAIAIVQQKEKKAV